jgi:hypothetical protein
MVSGPDSAADYLDDLRVDRLIMSLEPAWMSTIFGLIFVASGSLSALAFTIVMMSWLRKRPDESRHSDTAFS